MRADDKDIVETLKACPENGFRMLMAKYQEAVYWHIRRLVVSHDDAQDASQETFVRIYRSFDQYRGDSSLRCWIYRIATNEALRIIGKRRQEVVSMEAETFSRFHPSSSWRSICDTMMSWDSTKSPVWLIPHQPASRHAIMLPKRKLSST